MRIGVVSTIYKKDGDTQGGNLALAELLLYLDSHEIFRATRDELYIRRCPIISMRLL